MIVKKTIKLFIDGKFPRTESGKVFAEYQHKSKKIYANICQASRKDLRNSVDAAKKGLNRWAAVTPFVRGQILYRMAEMGEGKRSEFIELFTKILGISKTSANKEVDQLVDTFIHFAGFCDKFQHLTGTINAVNGPYRNYTLAESSGVIFLVCDDKFSLQDIISNIASIIVGGNSVITLLGKECCSVLAPLAEMFATSDLPAGTVNLLTGNLEELAPHFAAHMEINAISFQSYNKKILKLVTLSSAENMKRITPPCNKNASSLEKIKQQLEYKTIWHSMGF